MHNLKICFNGYVGDQVSFINISPKQNIENIDLY